MTTVAPVRAAASPAEPAASGGPTGGLRIAYLTTCSPLRPTSGHALRTGANWRALQALGEVRLYAFDQRPPLAERLALAAEGIRALPARREPPAARIARHLRSFATGRSMLYAKAVSPRRVARLAAELRAWGADLLVIGETWLADLLPELRGAATRTIVDTHNVESRLYARIAAEQGWPGKAKWLAFGMNARRIERRDLKAADAVWAVSEADAEVYRGELGLGRVAVVPNGVDTEGAYAPRASEPVEPGTIVCTGTYAYFPNHAAALHLIGLSRRLDGQGVPHRMLIVGRDPAPQLHEEARTAPSVTITGPVPDVRPYIARAALVAAPLTSGSGTKYKVLEALALGRPVLTTPVGAEGLDLRDGIEAAVVPTLDAFDERAAALLRDPARTEAMGAAGREWVVATHSPAAMRRIVAAAVAEVGLPVPAP